MTRRDALKNLGLFVAGSPLLHSQFIPRDTHQRVPSLDEITSAFEFEPVARAKILRASYDYITGGVEGEYSLRRNRKGFDWVTLIPRVVGGVSSVDLSTAVLRQQMPSPIFISPSSGHQRLHREGEKETHRGATAAGVTMIVSNDSSFGTARDRGHRRRSSLATTLYPPEPRRRPREDRSGSLFRLSGRVPHRRRAIQFIKGKTNAQQTHESSRQLLLSPESPVEGPRLSPPGAIQVFGPRAPIKAGSSLTNSALGATSPS